MKKNDPSTVDVEEVQRRVARKLMAVLIAVTSVALTYGAASDKKSTSDVPETEAVGQQLIVATAQIASTIKTS